MKLNIPYHKQETSYTCGPSCVKMVLNYFKKNISEKRLADLEKSMPKSGTSHMHMIKCINKLNFFCFVHDKASIHSIKHFIKLKLPVIVNYINPKGHYALITGYDKNNLILNDPHYGKNYKISFNKFERLWISGDHHYKEWILVINKKEFSLGRQYKP